MDDTWETLEWCSKCREYHLVTEDAGTWICQGKRPVIKVGTPMEDEEEVKLLDMAMQRLEEIRIL
jgi:hypothetical protein